MTEEFDVQAFTRGINQILVLSTLREGAKHGYQIALDVEAASNGLFSLQHGTLYPILHRLEAEGLIRGQWSETGGRKKKVYSITAEGRSHLSGEGGRVRHVLETLLTLLKGPGGARI